MKNPINWEKFIETISEEEMHQCISDYEILRKIGIVGNCVLRSYAQKWHENIGVPMSIVSSMENIAMHSYRHFAMKYLKSKT